MKAKLAFYKGEGNIVDKAIRFWTNSPYSHVELVINNDWYSTSPRDKQVRKKQIIPKPDHWEFVDVNIDYQYVLNLFERTKGSKYDWSGIWLSQFIPFGIHNKTRWFCSEWCAEALSIKHSNKYSPGRLYKYITTK